MVPTTDIIIAGCTLIGTVLSTVLAVSKILGKRFDKIDGELKEIRSEIKEIRSDITDVKVKVGSLEGSFIERGQWEGRLYSMKNIMSAEKK